MITVSWNMTSYSLLLLLLLLSSSSSSHYV